MILKMGVNLLKILSNFLFIVAFGFLIMVIFGDSENRTAFSLLFGAFTSASVAFMENQSKLTRLFFLIPIVVVAFSFVFKMI